MNDPDKRRVIEAAVVTLSEHFDAVQIMACHLDPDGQTRYEFSGSGLSFARVGLAHVFIDADKARLSADEIANALDADAGEE